MSLPPQQNPTSEPEVHLFLIWSNGLKQKEAILRDIERTFDLIEEYTICWTVAEFSRNLSRLYGENLPRFSNKSLHCGRGDFACFVVMDAHPVYGLRSSSKGVKMVNTRVFDKKSEYREWTGGGHKVHATDHAGESMIQLQMLLQTTYTEFLNNTNQEVRRGSVGDLQGAGGWPSLQDMFQALNGLVDYVVLRNFSDLESVGSSDHPDIDLMTSQPSLCARLLNAEPIRRAPWRVQHRVRIGGESVFMDIRYLGDDYYCNRWERDMLSSRVTENCFFVPNPEHHFYSLLYHVLLHKKDLSEEYVSKLSELGLVLGIQIASADFSSGKLLDLLLQFMHSKGYELTEPRDISVFWHTEALSDIGPARPITWLRKLIRLDVRRLAGTFIIDPFKVLLRLTIFRGR